VGPQAFHGPSGFHGPNGFHGPHPYYAHWYHGDWHDHWAHPWYCGPVGWFSVGFVAGAVVCDVPWRWGYWSYYNPYFTEVVVVAPGTVIDYSQPIVLAPAPTAAYTAAAAPNAPPPESEASRLLDASRTAFSKGDYQQAMTLANQAIAKRPSDPVPHEFRALILFATKQYRAASGAIYAVLSVGPGWDWTTLSSFYPDPNVYTAQLRALEQYGRENPTLPEVRFLLAYHYMSCGFNDQAAMQLQEVVRLSPKDQLSAQLLAGLSAPKTAPTPALGQPTAAALPVKAESLAGDWRAARADGAAFSFRLTADGTYRWQYTQNGKAQEFSGAFSVADNLLILKKDGNPAMIGQVVILDPNHFNFKLVGTNASDPGLTFSK
jgi:tetratricopeptide (TPR) repeat protein